MYPVTESLDRSLIKISLILLAGAIVALLDTTMVSVALADLSREFGAAVGELQLVSTAYLLAMAVVIPLMGWLVDRWGAKAAWMLSVGLFLCGSALCGTAWSVHSLVLARVIQGMGAGLILPLMQAILAQAAGPRRFGRAMSLVAIPGQLAPILGPVLGGALLTGYNWRWIFFVNLPISLVALLLAWRGLPDRSLASSFSPSSNSSSTFSPHSSSGPSSSSSLASGPSPGSSSGSPTSMPPRSLVSRTPSFDFVGFMLLSPGLAALVYGLSLAGTSGSFFSPPAAPWLAAGALLVAGFAASALRKGDGALLDVGLLRHRSYAATCCLTFLFGIAIYGPMFLLPLYFQWVWGDEALAAGAMLAPQGAGTMAAIALAGRWSDRAGPRPVVLAGMSITALATLAFMWTDLWSNLAPSGAQASRWLLALTLFVRGTGLGAAGIPAMAAAYHGLKARDIARATGGVNVMQRLGASFGTAFLAVVLQRGMGVATGTAAGFSSGQIADAFGGAFGWTLAFTLVALIPAFLLPGNRDQAPQMRAG